MRLQCDGVGADLEEALLAALLGCGWSEDQRRAEHDRVTPLRERALEEELRAAVRVERRRGRCLGVGRGRAVGLPVVYLRGPRAG